MLERLAATSGEQVNNFLYQVFGGGIGGSGSGNSSGTGSKNETTGSKNLFRGDDRLYSAKRPNGILKSHLNSDGDLVPANVDGMYNGRKVTVTEHILGGYRRGAKGNSPYTSFTDKKGIISSYGDNTIKLDLLRLTKDVNAGKVKGVEILTPDKVKSAIRVDSTTSAYWRDLALKWTQRDNEYLIKGIIPKDYITIVSGGN